MQRSKNSYAHGTIGAKAALIPKDPTLVIKALPIDFF